MGLTEEQRVRMEQKKAEALAKMKSKTNSSTNPQIRTSASEVNKVTSQTKIVINSDKIQSYNNSVKPNVMSVISNNSPNKSLSEQ